MDGVTETTTDGVTGDSVAGSARAAITALTRAGETVATAESLTGGLVAAALTSVPGASVVVRGGVIAYTRSVKAAVLGVDAVLLQHGGAVQGEVARQMAIGARRLCDADWGVATTGVAGPEPSDGQPVGTVFVGVSGPDGDEIRSSTFEGSREAIRAQTVVVCLDRLTAGVRARFAGASGYR